MKKLWTLIDGKKITIACLYWSVLIPALSIYFPAGIPAEINRPVIIAGLLLSALGLGHRVAKTFMNTQE